MSRPRPTYSGVAATLALVISLGGTSYAAVKITSKDIKDNTIVSADVHDGTLSTKDLSSETRSDLKGAPGPPGVKGDPGIQGPPGEPGPGGTPTGAAGGVLNGAYPNPTLADHVVDYSKTTDFPYLSSLVTGTDGPTDGSWHVVPFQDWQQGTAHHITVSNNAIIPNVQGAYLVTVSAKWFTGTLTSGVVNAEDDSIGLMVASNTLGGDPTPDSVVKYADVQHVVKAQGNTQYQTVSGIFRNPGGLYIYVRTGSPNGVANAGASIQVSVAWIGP